MATLGLAVGIGLAALPLLLYTYPTLSAWQIPFSTTPRHALKNGVIVTPRISTFIEEAMALENITGLSISFVQKSGDAEFHTYGVRTEGGDRMIPDTLFYVGSLSKAFCVAAMGVLIDDFANGHNVTSLPSGLTELTWHTKLSDLLPEWQLMDEWASKRANLRDILSHASGLARHELSYGPADTPQEMVARLRHLSPAYELRERHSYCNIMYMVAAHVIETFSGRSYTSFVKERIFGPLGMTSSTFSLTEANSTGMYTEGWTKGGRRVPDSLDEDAAFLLAGPGGVISSVTDMAKWVSTWIRKGVYDDQIVIPPSVYRNATNTYSIVLDHPIIPEYFIETYGMGWRRTSYRGHDILFHLGGLPWVSTLVAFLPTEEIGVILFANGDGQQDILMLIRDRILDSALHLASSLTNDAPSNPLPLEPKCTTEVSRRNLMFPLDVFSGTYANPGYGSFTLCAPSDLSSNCINVRSNFSAVDNVRGDPDSQSQDLLGEWSRVVSSHLRLRHQRGVVFDVYFTSLYPRGWGRDKTPFETAEIGQSVAQAEFVIEDGTVVGFGMSGLHGELTERARKHETVRGRADVWFDKVS